MKAFKRTINPNRIKGPVKIRILLKIFIRFGVFRDVFRLPALFFLKSRGPKCINRTTKAYVNRIINTNIYHNTLVNNLFLHNIQHMVQHQHLYFRYPIESRCIVREIPGGKISGLAPGPASRLDGSIIPRYGGWDNIINHRHYNRIPHVIFTGQNEVFSRKEKGHSGSNPPLLYELKESRVAVFSDGGPQFIQASVDKHLHEAGCKGRIGRALKPGKVSSVIMDHKKQTQHETGGVKYRPHRIITGDYLNFAITPSGQGPATISGRLSSQNTIISRALEYANNQKGLVGKGAFQQPTMQAFRRQGVESVLQAHVPISMPSLGAYKESKGKSREIVQEYAAVDRERANKYMPVYTKPLRCHALSLIQRSVYEKMVKHAGTLAFQKTSSRHDGFISKIMDHSNLPSGRTVSGLVMYLKNLDYKKDILKQGQRGLNAFSDFAETHYVQQIYTISGPVHEGRIFKERRMIGGRREEIRTGEFPQVVYKRESYGQGRMEAERQREEPVVEPNETHTVYEYNDKRTKTHEINIVADKVYRILEKKISIERERRGFN